MDDIAIEPTLLGRLIGGIIVEDVDPPVPAGDPRNRSGNAVLVGQVERLRFGTEILAA